MSQSVTGNILRESARRAVLTACNLNPHNDSAREQADALVESIVDVVLHEVDAARRQDQRVQLAGMALQGLLSNGAVMTSLGYMHEEKAPAMVVVAAARYADALIALLGKTGQPEQSTEPGS